MVVSDGITKKLAAFANSHAQPVVLSLFLFLYLANFLLTIFFCGICKTYRNCSFCQIFM